jgi:hypothetical protein
VAVHIQASAWEIATEMQLAGENRWGRGAHEVRRAPPRRVSPHRPLSDRVVCLCVSVFVCVLYSRVTVGASYVGRPICVGAVSRTPPAR